MSPQQKGLYGDEHTGVNHIFRPQQCNHQREHKVSAIGIDDRQLLFCRIRLPETVSQVLDVFSGFTGPLAMIVAGILLSGIKKEQLLHFRCLPLVILLRLVVVPLVLLVALRFLGLDRLLHMDGKILTVCFLSCITPSASTIVQLAQVFTDDATYASALNAVGMLLCIVSMPLMVLLYDIV